MKKVAFPLFSRIALAFSGVFFGVYLLIEFLKLQNIYIYLLGVGVKEIMPFIVIPCVALLISAIGVFLYKNAKNTFLKILSIVLMAILSVVAYFYILFGCFFTPESKYFEYTSVDQQHTIVVNEMSFLLDGGGDIYEKTSFCTMKRVGRYSTDDGFRPFTGDAFFFIWNEENFELHYDFGNCSGYRVVKMEYAK